MTGSNRRSDGVITFRFGDGLELLIIMKIHQNSEKSMGIYGRIHKNFTEGCQYIAGTAPQLIGQVSMKMEIGGGFCCGPCRQEDWKLAAPR